MTNQQANSPAISVIIPIYNASAFLEQALCSVRSQTLENIEIICINDGSTDNSLEIMQHHAAEDARIRIIDKQNEGYGASCNRGIDEASGLYLAILEPDDWIEPNMYLDMIAFAGTFAQDASGPIDIIKTPYWRIWMPDTPEQRKINCSYRGRIKPRTQPFRYGDQGTLHLMHHHPSIWSALYRARFIRENGIRFKPIPGAGWADNPFLAETLLRAQSIVYLDKPYYCYREETPEKTKNAATKDTLTPFERWHDMKDVMDDLGVTEAAVARSSNPADLRQRYEGILRVHNERGFTYLSNALSFVDMSAPGLEEIVKRMFARMDDELVFSDDTISPYWRNFYAQVKGIAAPHIKPCGYYAKVIAQGFYSLVNIGPAMTLSTLKSFANIADAAQSEDAKL